MEYIIQSQIAGKPSACLNNSDLNKHVKGVLSKPD